MTEVGAADTGVLEHRVDGSVGDQTTEVEDDKSLGGGGNHLEVVLNEQHGGAALFADPPQYRDQLHPLGPVETRRGFVEHQQPWLAHQRAGELDETPVAKTERLDRNVSFVGKTDELQQVVRGVPFLGAGATHAQ